MYAIFFTTKGLAIQVSIPKGRSMNARSYKTKVLRKFVIFYQQRRPNTGILGINVLHDNAASHKAGSVTSFLKEQGVYVLEHPPYSPDLAPCDFFLFSRLKKNLAGRKYASRQKFGAAVFNLLRDIQKKRL